MQAIVEPGTISGTITAPPSKSIMQRACAAALLHNGKTIINNPGNSADDKAALNIIQQLGAEISYTENGILEIISTGVQPTTDINCGESGLSARLFIPIAACTDKAVTITGSGSLLKRPMTEYLSILPELGVTIKSNNDTLPFKVTGPLQPKDITVDGSLSSQFISGLLITFAFYATEPVTITVDRLTSKPYIDLTLQVLEHFGKQVANKDYKAFTITPTEEETQDIFINIEGDWSAASAMLVAGAIAGDITIEGIDRSSLQGDKAIVNILKQAGATVEENEYSVSILRPEMLAAFEYDATDTPDLFPVLSVLAGVCKGESTIRGVKRLIHKESNRIVSISDMLSALGIFHSVYEDELVIEGKEMFQYAKIDGYNDHRIVMAASIAALRSKGPVTIHGMEAVNKSYPDFFAHLSLLGASVMQNIE
ncbi:MAG: 3-phosphoshikimate 1-carboxyvinyltransferase [Chitinophagaceae bacterium]|nr:3-phosphoshikimate 1-carboxyvinyltransferase [Chitinophagaceae bacterium]